MLDTKLKKSSKLAKVLICLTVILPALLLVSLYPRMEKVMLHMQEEYTNQVMNNSKPEIESTNGMTIETNMVNYALEASYYLYGQLLQEARQAEVNFGVLDRFGWIDDYYRLSEECHYLGVYTDEKGVTYESSNAGENQFQSMRDLMNELISAGNAQESLTVLESEMVAALIMEFDNYGMITNISLVSQDGVQYHSSVYTEAKESIAKYQNNANYYVATDYPEQADSVMDVLPKNFRVIFTFTKDSEFVHSFGLSLDYWIRYFSNPQNLYLEMGAPIVVIVLAAFVALMALILPFFKKLNTGWEPLFSLHLEIVCVMLAACLIGVYAMFLSMCHSTYFEVNRSIGSMEILGYVLEAESIYGFILILNVFGWSLCFMAEYAIVAHFRQFLCGPIYYLKNRLLIVCFVRWIGRQIKRLGHYLTNIDITDNLHRTILKIVLANFVVVSILSFLWIGGIAGAVIYSIILYMVLRKKGKMLQAQYGSVLHATRQMAEGELRITLEEDLGLFESLGEELERVQEGFSKAVAEEAKSQNMRTELISNVSHDLKTPLTAIITYINLLKQEGLSDSDRKAYINTLDMKSQRLKVLIEDLFEVSKAQSGNIQLNIMDVDVVSLMKQLRLEMEDKLADSDLTFRFNLPEEKVILQLDGQKTYRIFENLLSNALKYAMPHSRVYIDVNNGESEVEIVFKNISATEIETDAKQLTERFVRGDSSRTTEGSGLGLAIVKSFVELQGGNFKIDVDGDLFKAVITWKKV